MSLRSVHSVGKEGSISIIERRENPSEEDARKRKRVN